MARIAHGVEIGAAPDVTRGGMPEAGASIIGGVRPVCFVSFVCGGAVAGAAGEAGDPGLVTRSTFGRGVGAGAGGVRADAGAVSEGDGVRGGKCWAGIGTMMAGPLPGVRGGPGLNWYPFMGAGGSNPGAGPGPVGGAAVI